MIGKPRDLWSDRSGKGVIKFTLGTCVLAIATATASPAFEANPLIGNVVTDMRHHLPETLEKARKALGGD